MSTMTRSSKGAATRDQILDAGSRLIRVRGYHCTSLDDVLRESGVGKGNFYYYFKSKEELAHAIIDRIVEGFLERTLEPAFADPAAAPLDQIASLLDRIVDNLRAREGKGGCPMGNLASELSDIHEGFRARLNEVFVQWRARIAEALRRGQATGALRADLDAARAAHFLVAAIEGALLMSKVARDVAVVEGCVAELKGHLLLYRKEAS